VYHSTANGSEAVREYFVNGILKKRRSGEKTDGLVVEEVFDRNGESVRYTSKTRWPDARTKITEIEFADGRTEKIVVKYGADGKILSHESNKGTYYYIYDNNGDRTQRYEANLVN